MLSLDDPTAVLAAKLASARASATLSQIEAAKLIGCSLRSYQDYETGKAWPRPAMRRKLLAFIGEHEDQAA